MNWLAQMRAKVRGKKCAGSKPALVGINWGLFYLVPPPLIPLVPPPLIPLVPPPLIPFVSLPPPLIPLVPPPLIPLVVVPPPLIPANAVPANARATTTLTKTRFFI
jgi:hypothetical protein